MLKANLLAVWVSDTEKDSDLEHLYWIMKLFGSIHSLQGQQL